MTAQVTDASYRPDRRRLPSRKVVPLPIVVLAAPDAIEEWAGRYLDAAVRGVRSAEVADKIALHLARFRDHFGRVHHLGGHPRPCRPAARQPVCQGQRPAAARARTPSPDAGQIRTLKNLLDRLPRFNQHKGRRQAAAGELHGHARPLRATAHVLLSTGLRREELVNLDLDQVTPNTPEAVRAAKKAKISGARGKGGTSRNVFLSADARTALADYLEHERPADAADASTALFLSAASIGSRRPDGRLSPRSINLICEQIGHWHDAQHSDLARHISPLRPHDIRHSFAFALAEATGNDVFELQRRLGHQSQRYINRYTNPPEDIAAGYIEQM